MEHLDGYNYYGENFIVYDNSDGGFDIKYRDNFHSKVDKKLSNALATMLIWLHENKYLEE